MIKSISLLVRCLAAVAFGTSALSACSKTEQASPAAQQSPPPTNRVEINAAVRQNLGITFAKVEQREVARTIRMPGHFELMPEARREHRSPAAGIVDIVVRQYERVAPGAVLFRIDSPSWRALQRDLVDATAAVKLARADAESIGPLLDAHERHHIELQKSVDVWAERVATLERLRGSGAVKGDDLAQARSSLATATSNLAETLEKEAELEVRKAQTAAALEAAEGKLGNLLLSAATVTGRSVDVLRSSTQDGPAWQSIGAIEVRAGAAGVVNAIHASSGVMVGEFVQVVELVQPELVRFRAVGLQSDLARIGRSEGTRGVVVPAKMSGSQDQIEGLVQLAPVADSEHRTVDVVLAPSNLPETTWARAGVGAYLEVVVADSGGSELAIPLRCIVRDGTKSIIFRRDPGDPDKAIRLEADLGIDDGRWVVIKSGVAEGNDIVLDGAYQLMVATSGTVTRGGHFHPDGTFHEGED